MCRYKLTHPLMRQIILFFSVGVVCYFVAITLLMFFVEYSKMEVNLANVVASIITIFVCYLLNVKFVFKGGRYSRSKEILAFFIVAAFEFFFRCLTHVYNDDLPSNLVCNIKNYCNRGSCGIQFCG